VVHSQTNAVNRQLPPVPLKEVGALLLKHYGISNGLWDIGLQINVAIGQMGQTLESAQPGAMFTVPSMVLTPATVVGPMTLNAAELNPAK